MVIEGEVILAKWMSKMKEADVKNGWHESDMINEINDMLWSNRSHM